MEVPQAAPDLRACQHALPRRQALQQLAAIGAALCSQGVVPTSACALTVADVTPPVVAATPLPPREQAIVDGETLGHTLAVAGSTPVSHTDYGRSHKHRFLS
jgi:hypothetical protein